MEVRQPQSFSPLKLFLPGDEAHAGEDEFSPFMTLPEFFEAWFVPIVMVGKNRSENTIDSYRESLEWWEKLTGDPPLNTIDEFTIAAFEGKLPSCTYKRSPLPTAKEYPLTEHSVAKHLRNVRTILQRTGPTVDPRRPTKRLLDVAPCITVVQPKRSRPKPAFDLANVPALLTATKDPRMATPRIKGLRTSPWSWWRSLILVLFYTGLRIGTVKKLEFEMIKRRKDGEWLEIPGAIVDKTSKPLDKFLHSTAAAAIASIRTDRPLIFPWPHHRDYLGTCHKRLQVIAELPNKPLSPHAWRRTHAREMARLGARYGLKVAQRSLDHADDRTTSSFYCDLEAELIAQLPHLEPKRVEKQTFLF